MSDQLVLATRSAQHVTVQGDELLQRCILPNRHVTLRVLDLNAASDASNGSQSKSRVTFDLAQIFIDVEDSFLKNRTRIRHLVFHLFSLLQVELDM